MPKIAKTVSKKLSEFVRQFPILHSDGEVLTCKACNVAVNSGKLFNVQQHLKGKSHIDLESKFTQKHAMWKTPEKPPVSTFAHDLCEMMVSCDIPLYKLRSDKLRGFLDKYTTEAVPCETTLRNSYVPQMLTTLIDKIKDGFCKENLQTTHTA